MTNLLFFNGATFNAPLIIPDLELWLDASDTSTITESSNLVTQWSDKSGNSNNVTASGADRPTTNTTTMNSRNVIDFDGSNKLTLPSALYTIPQDSNTVIIVSKRNTEDASGNATIGMAESGTNRFFHLYSSVSGRQQYVNRAAGTAAVSVNDIVNTDFNIAACRRAATTLGIAINGATETTAVAGGSPATIDAGFVGAAGSGATNLDGSIAEILIYSRLLDADEILVILKYLSAKWKIITVNTIPIFANTINNGAASQTAVVCLHGTNGTGSNLRTSLGAEIANATAFYPTSQYINGSGDRTWYDPSTDANLTEYLDYMDNFIASLLAAGYENIILYGHSNGGTSVYTYMQERGNSNLSIKGIIVTACFLNYASSSITNPPIEHIHGTLDAVVPYAGVQTNTIDKLIAAPNSDVTFTTVTGGMHSLASLNAALTPETVASKIDDFILDNV